MKKLLFITLFFTVVSVFGNPIHVAVGSNDNNDGKSWQTAVASIQKAIELSKANQEIRIATGTYKVADLQIPRDTKMIGGFNVKAYRTKEKTTIFEPTGKDVLILRNISSNCSFENITFQKQRILSEKMNTIHGENVRFCNCSFLGNYTAFYCPVIAIRKGSVSFEKCAFARNLAEGNIGCFVSHGDSVASFVDCVFYANYAKWACGAVQFSGKSGLIKNCIFVGNKDAIRVKAEREGKNGRPIRLDVINCTFAGNFGGRSILSCETNKHDVKHEINMVNCLFSLQPVRSKLLPKNWYQKNKDVESPFNIEGSSELKIINSAIVYKGKLPFMDRAGYELTKVVGSMGKFDYVGGFNLPVIFSERIAKLNIGAGQDKMPQGVEFPKTDILGNPRPENNCIVGAVQKLSVNKK